MTETVLMIGTRKGLWIARSSDRETWSVDGPDEPVNEVHSVAIDTRGEQPRLLMGSRSWHWGTQVLHSDDLGATWAARRRPGDHLPRGHRHQPRGGLVARAVPGRPGRGVGRHRAVGAVEVDRRRPLVRAGPRAVGPPAPAAVGSGRRRPGHPHAAAAPHRPAADDTSRCPPAASTAAATGARAGSPRARASRSSSTPRTSSTPPGASACTRPSRDPENPDRLYAQNHGGVYRSDDAGTSWTSIADGLPSDFGFPVVAHPRRGDTVSLFPLVDAGERFPKDGRARVYRSKDAGATWEELGKGLPDGFYTAVMRDAHVRRRRRPGRRLHRQPRRHGVRQQRRGRVLAGRGASTSPTCSASAPPH